MRDDDLLERFERGDVDDFPHLDHVKVVYLQTRRSGAEAAVPFARQGLQRLTRLAGVPDKYHETITVAWAHLVSREASVEPGADFDDFIEHHPHLARPDLLADYYSPELLSSPQARAGFVAPDRRALP